MADSDSNSNSSLGDLTETEDFRVCIVVFLEEGVEL